MAKSTTNLSFRGGEEEGECVLRSTLGRRLGNVFTKLRTGFAFSVSMSSDRRGELG